MIVGGEYPLRPAFSLLSKVLDEFSTAVPQSSYGNPSSIQFPQLQTYLEKYQDPKQADAIMKVQAELDETKIILVSHRAACCDLMTALKRILHITAQDNRRCAGARYQAR